MSLGPDKLRRVKDPGSWKLEGTDSLRSRPSLHPIGQERAVEALEFGLAVSGRGYNIFLTGQPGSGRTSYALARLKSRAKGLPVPDDWLYLYNFDEPGEPLAVSVPAGEGRKLASALDALLNDLKVTISKAFEQSQYEDAKAQYVREFQEKAGAIMETLRAQAAKHRFSLKRTPQGFINIPLVEDKDENGKKIIREIKEEEFEALSDKRQKRYQALSEKVSQKTLLGLRRIRDMEKELKEKLSRLESEICRAAIAPCLADICGAWSGNRPLSSWFARMAEDVIENFGAFVTSMRDESADLDFSRYQANLFVSNDPEAGAPVVWETNPTYYNLSGKVEYESRQGCLYTDFRRITAGAFHRANGGFLVLDAEKVLMNFMSWEAVKRLLRTEEAAIENMGEQYGSIPVSSLRPGPIKMNIKVILIGSPCICELLQNYDPEFQKLFKIRASFDVDMPRSAKTERQMAQCVAGILEREGLKPFDAEALSEIIEWAGREAGDQNLLSVELGRLRELLVESSAWAGILSPEAKRVGAPHVRKAIEHKRYRSALYQEKLIRAFQDGVIRVDTTGSVVGQINGLSVIDLTDCCFGHPSRITANVFMGHEGVVNIEREVRMTGPIHNKGLMILSSYLGRQYARDMPLSLSARITFEQNYSGIEGDSASSTELYCLLSALAELPLKQGIAVTGSVDQFGNVQPIGGVNEKIEGFFEYCRLRGLTGDQGVMIPQANIRHLMLNPEVIQAVREGKFSVWAVSTIDEGIEILTGVPAGRLLKSGSYTKGSVHGRVRARLRKMLQDNIKLKKDLLGGRRSRRGSKKDQ
ncbi:MAG: AAA family ATPase [Fretibacterium sp.]|nr:AAA family ATPase [Fretibacterium sp.]